MAVAQGDEFWQNLTTPALAKVFYPEERIAMFFPRIPEGAIRLSVVTQLVVGGITRPKRRMKPRFWAILAKPVRLHHPAGCVTARRPLDAARATPDTARTRRDAAADSPEADRRSWEWPNYHEHC